MARLRKWLDRFRCIIGDHLLEEQEQVSDLLYLLHHQEWIATEWRCVRCGRVWEVRPR